MDGNVNQLESRPENRRRPGTHFRCLVMRCLCASQRRLRRRYKVGCEDFEKDISPGLQTRQIATTHLDGLVPYT
jgi:hypothetical protein